MKNTAKRIVFIGSGNVATHLAQALDVKNKVIAVYSREQSHAERLCKKLKKAKAYSDPSLLPTDADFYIVAVNDDAIEEVAKSVQVSSGIWVHTSGSVPAWIFKDIKDNYILRHFCFDECSNVLSIFFQYVYFDQYRIFHLLCL